MQEVSREFLLKSLDETKTMIKMFICFVSAPLIYVAGMGPYNLSKQSAVISKTKKDIQLFYWKVKFLEKNWILQPNFKRFYTKNVIKNLILFTSYTLQNSVATLAQFGLYYVSILCINISE